MRFPINKGFIEVIEGDITEQDVVAIVNAANNHLWMGGGVAGAIKRKGGEEIEREAVAQGPIEIGDAVMTGGGSLRARYVIHAAVMGQDLHTNEEAIKRATRSSLVMAEKNNIQSIAFPALGTGVGGFSLFYCAKLMLTETIEFLVSARNTQSVRFVLFGSEAFAAFEQELKLQFSSKRH